MPAVPPLALTDRQGRATRAPMQPPTSPNPTKLKIRAYECRLTARKVKLGLEKLVESSPAFNESWLLGEFDVGSRIGGDAAVRGYDHPPPDGDARKA